ncbi:hypothetical protein KUTeg_016734 [Tegillarca granosa]|uniref:Disease resistance R13L4/SHOC-2-like LRR domain-containing protein n=1 Tax=Tegillarca granosa TaxID=220873 RepID=A0ABQ9ELU3_TEGGR|nr:hypothetical protein KUTeg_016734 [Tegillarca granosa]
MAFRGKKKSQFGRVPDPVTQGVHPSILKQARRSGQLNLTSRGLSTVPDAVWYLHQEIPGETQDVSFDQNPGEAWWDQVDLTKLILASNFLVAIPDDIRNFPYLSVLDLHDNRMETLPDALNSLEHLIILDISRNRFKVFPRIVCEIYSLGSLHLEHNELVKLDGDIGNLPKLEDLDISHNAITGLPEGIGNMRKLRKLNVSHNKISYIPIEIGTMTELRLLDANNNQLEYVPPEIGNLKNIEQLYLRHNKLKELPLLEFCSNLKELHLGNNGLLAVSAEFLKKLESVTVLDLRDNKLSEFPPEVSFMSNLERIDLSNNNLSQLPFSLGGIQSLNSIVLDGNPMKTIRRDIILRGTVELKKYLQGKMPEAPEEAPDKVKGVWNYKGQSGIIGGDAGGIKAHEVQQSKLLNLSGRNMDSIPDDIMAVAMKGQVNTVNISKNNYKDLPRNLILLEGTLRHLDVSFNKLTYLHSEISLYLKLTSLDLRNNYLENLPLVMESLQELRELIISYNRFKELPMVIYHLKKLEILMADNNSISAIDVEGFRSMSMIATLDLQNNNIANIPPELGLCTQLKALELSGNPCRNPRPAILAKGTNAILEYLRSRIVQPKYASY